MIGRIVVSDVSPVVACARWPAKAVVGERIPIGATVFREGHDLVGATAVLRPPPDPATGGRAPRPVSARMEPVGSRPDRWEVEVAFDRPGRWTFWVEGWADPVASWHHALEAKIAAGQDVSLELEEGALLMERAAGTRTPGSPVERAGVLRAAAAGLRAGGIPAAVLRGVWEGRVSDLLAAHPLRDFVSSSPRYAVWVDRERALFGSWYELFPRSEGDLRAAANRLPAIAQMGFDVVYLPPVHPIGGTSRKGADNALTAGPGDPGSPWAIGGPEGGHDAVHPDLGSLEDFDDFVAAAHGLGMEVALDLALQTSPDHPWVTDHPEWFGHRADGSIAYAENPPKKYEDIYPLDFERDPDGLRAEVLRVVRHWIGHGVRIFRVDNPHTKPLWIWEWLIAEVKRTDPDVRGELEEYLSELTTSPTADYMRPNFFVNTPDILHAFLQYGGPAAFKIRAVLAATMVPSYGVYSGYELYEHEAVRPGSEEYRDSEKYQVKKRDWTVAEQRLAPYLRRLNAVRRSHPALQQLRGLVFHGCDNPDIVVYSRSRDADTVLTVVNLDPHSTREATVHLDLKALGLPWDARFAVHDQLGSGETFAWTAHNYVRLDPFVEPAHLFVVAAP